MARSTSLYEQLTCSVCLECYKDPRTLPCHHSFCRVCLDNVKAPISDEEFEEAGQPTIMCPVCRNSIILPPGGVKELPAAFLLNNLLEIQKATTSVNAQLPSQGICDIHERVLEFYCNDCDVLLCSVCSIKVHRAHDCDLAADVAKANKKVIEDQLALLRRDASIADSMIAKVDSANDRMISEGDEIRKAITDAVQQLYRQIEEEKRKLLTMVDQNIVEKLQVLKNHRDKGIAMITQMRRSESVVESRLEKFKDSIEIMAVKDQLVELVIEAQLKFESIKFTAPNMLSFHSNPIPSTEIGFLFEPVEKNAYQTIAAGKKCHYMLYHTRAETNPVCHLVPSKNNFKPVECQVVFLENGKHEISFTPTRVGDHDLILFPLSPIKKTTAAQLLVNSPFLQEDRKQISKQILSKPSAMAITRTGDLVVCETACNWVAVPAGDDGKKLNTISSLCSSKKCLNKPCCVGVTPDNCLIVVDSGRQCYRLLKIQMNGKLISTASLADKLKFQSPNALAIHPCGEIFVVDSDAHSIYVFNADLTLSRTFGGKGKTHGYFDQPHSIAFDSAGSAYVSDSMNNHIQKFSASEEGLLQFDAVIGSGNRSEPSFLKRPTALCISCYDTIFVTDEHNRIAAFDTQGCFLGEVHYSKISLTNPCAMVIGKDESHLSVLDSYVEALYIIQ